jgi:hypothetical protein
MEFWDGLNRYPDDREFWSFPSRLEVAATGIAASIPTSGASLSEGALLAAHNLLMDIELSKAGCMQELTGRAVRNAPLAVWNAFREAPEARSLGDDVGALLSSMRLEGLR